MKLKTSCDLKIVIIIGFTRMFTTARMNTTITKLKIKSYPFQRYVSFVSLSLSLYLYVVWTKEHWTTIPMESIARESSEKHQAVDINELPARSTSLNVIGQETNNTTLQPSLLPSIPSLAPSLPAPPPPANRKRKAKKKRNKRKKQRSPRIKKKGSKTISWEEACTFSFACPKEGCNEQFDNHILFISHLKKFHHKGENINKWGKCPWTECGVLTAQSQNYILHDIVAGPQDVDPYHCSKCSETFRHRQMVPRHMKEVHCLDVLVKRRPNWRRKSPNSKKQGETTFSYVFLFFMKIKILSRKQLQSVLPVLYPTPRSQTFFYLTRPPARKKKKVRGKNMTWKKLKASLVKKKRVRWTLIFQTLLPPRRPHRERKPLHALQRLCLRHTYRIAKTSP